VNCGTAKGYRRGCRCESCRAAWAKCLRDYRKRVGIKRTAAQRAAERRYEMKRKAKRKLKTSFQFRVLNVRKNYLADDEKRRETVTVKNKSEHDMARIDKIFAALKSLK